MNDFYRNNWHGTFDGSEEELTLLLSRARDIIDNAIYLSGVTVDTVPDVHRERVYKAVCAQADRIEANGGVGTLTESGCSSLSLGQFSCSVDLTGSLEPLCLLSYEYLHPTGLLYRGL